MQSFQKLDVWNEAIEMVVLTYQLKSFFPAEEKFALTNQLMRSAVSVPANIAEGYGRTHLGEYIHHVSIARGSLMEMQTHLIIAGRLKYLTKPQVRAVWRKSESVGKMLTKLIISLQKRDTGKFHP